MKPDEFKVSKPQRKVLVDIWKAGGVVPTNVRGFHGMTMKKLQEHKLVTWDVGAWVLTELGHKVVQQYRKREDARGSEDRDSVDGRDVEPSQGL